MKIKTYSLFLLLNIIFTSAIASEASFQLPHFERIELKNGVVIFLMERGPKMTASKWVLQA